VMAVSRPSEGGQPGRESGVLAGLRVIELADTVAVAHCGRLFADHGADVITVESKPARVRRAGNQTSGGENSQDSGLYMCLSACKRGVALDYESERGRALLARLVGMADVVIHGWTETKAAAVGLDRAALAEHAGLVCVAITPFGQQGPWAAYDGDDLICCAAGNISFGIGARAGRPLQFPLTLASHEAGAMAFVAAMAAVVGNARANQRDALVSIDVATTDVLASMFSTGITAYPYRGVVGRRNGNHGLALYPDVFLPCADGYVGVVCNQLQQWIRLLALMGDPDWVENPRYRDRRRMTEEYPEEVDELLKPWFEERSREEIFALCREHDIPVAPAYSVAELLVHPHLVEREAFRTVEVDDGVTVALPRWPAVFSSLMPVPWRRAPRYGEHTDEVLSETLALTGEERQQLRGEAVIA
jgi:CoA:oxalate CoA-transferase